ncbi:MAG: ABC transporter ATP-binding protein [Candidatus Bathyarchaeia archaeon]
MAGIYLKNLTKRFGDTVAVNDLTLEIGDGEFVCLLGPSGCGKTTTLRCIAGLERHDDGNIYIGGTLVDDLPPVERDIAMVFQFPVVYPGMTVKENLAFPLKQRGYSKGEVNARVMEISKILRLEGIMDSMASDLDIGARQRVAIGRALVRQPKALLLDEALTNMDTRLKLMMIAELKKLHEELHQTTVYVTHDQSEAMMMADRIAVMNLGVLQQYDTPDALYHKPENLFVAGFIGSPPMNFIDVTVDSVGEALIYGETQMRWPHVRELLKGKTGHELILGFRPEYASIHKACPSGEHIKGRVDVAEFIGDHFSLDVQTERDMVKVLVERGVDVKIGEDVCLELRRIHLFDKATGEVIA